MVASEHIELIGRLRDNLERLGFRIKKNALGALCVEGAPQRAVPKPQGPAAWPKKSVVDRAREIIVNNRGQMEVGPLGTQLTKEGFQFSSLSQTLRNGGLHVETLGKSTAVASLAPPLAPQSIVAPSKAQQRKPAAAAAAATRSQTMVPDFTFATQLASEFEDLTKVLPSSVVLKLQTS